MKTLTALIIQDTLSEALRKGKRFLVKIDGKPDGERTTFKAAQALARQRGATDYVITSSSYEIKPTDTRHSLMQCNRKWFKDGITETRCKNEAQQVCSKCGNARCRKHDDLGFDEVDGVTLCEECEPEPERAYCANCKQVQLLEGYDDAEVRAAMGDVKQCVACGHIVDSERSEQ